MKNLKHGLKAIVTIVFFIYPQITLANPLNLLNNISKLDTLNMDCNLSKKKQPIYLTQRRGKTGCWKLIYSVDGIVYESVLILKGDRGKMLTTYFNPNIGRTDYVEQTMKVTNSPRGILILGSNPVYPNSNRRHPSYNPDSFLLQIRTSGEVVIATCDTASQCSFVDVEDCPLN